MTPPCERVGELVVRLTRISPTHHRLDLASGARAESRELETRSCLLHDLVHFALETEAQLADSFYGKLARGQSYAELMQPGADMKALGEIATTERIVGPLQSAWKAGFDPARFLATLRSYHEQISEPLPPWCSVELFACVAARLRALTGAWGATPFGDALELRFVLPRDA